MADFGAAFLIVLEHEGAFSDDPMDKGGATNFGITESVARENGYTGPMNQLPLYEAKRIYEQEYWKKLNLDKVYWQDVANEIFDMAVNQGPGFAAKSIQTALNLLNRDNESWEDIPEDGVIGQRTLSLINNVSMKDSTYITKVLNGIQFCRYMEICRRDPTQEKFFRGWIKRT